MSDLHNKFNEVAKRPALRFELKNGLVGISERYNFPDDISVSEFEELYTWTFNQDGSKIIPIILHGTGLPECTSSIEPDFKTFLRNTSPSFQGILKDAWGMLVRLNPVLKNVKLDTNDPYHIYNSLHGVVSGFNVDDINNFLHLIDSGKPPGGAMRKDPVYGPDINWIEANSKGGLCWVASPKTLDNIKAQLKNKF